MLTVKVPVVAISAGRDGPQIAETVDRLLREDRLRIETIRSDPSADLPALFERVEHGCEVVLWLGGAEEPLPFRPDLHIAFVDALVAASSGDGNVKIADVVVIGNAGSVGARARVAELEERIRETNPNATIVPAGPGCRLEPAGEIQLNALLTSVIASAYLGVLT